MGAEEEIKKIFEPFYRIEKDRSRATGGTGLGLSISKMITRLHDGEIKIKSQPGNGTTVSVMLPA